MEKVWLNKNEIKFQSVKWRGSWHVSVNEWSVRVFCERGGRSEISGIRKFLVRFLSEILER